MKFYDRLKINQVNGTKQLAVLIDPDRTHPVDCLPLVEKCSAAGVDYFFIGSSLLTGDNFEKCLEIFKRSTRIPVIIFPGNAMQISENADALLFLSLISGRNPELLIGRHVIAAPVLRRSGIEVVPTGYMLIDSGAPTSVSYMSYTLPIPRDKSEIAACTAMAGEMLGMKIIYLDAGSGARYAVSPEMISQVRNQVSIPLIVGGGIRTRESATAACQAGADVIVVGNAIEKDPELIFNLSAAVHSYQTI
jgi:phosphoglycerol geranylgeranyltransferase